MKRMKTLTGGVAAIAGLMLLAQNAMAGCGCETVCWTECTGDICVTYCGIQCQCDLQ